MLARSVTWCGGVGRFPLAQKALQELSCLGDSVEIAMLSVVHGTPEDEVHSELWEGGPSGAHCAVGALLQVVHDRVREAAYSLIPEQLRAETHLRVGRVLWTHFAPEKSGEVVFEIVNQLNRDAALITSRDEREQLAELNLIAGKRARASTAYASALRYLVAGCELLPEDSWEERYPLTFTLEFQRAECEFLTGDFAAAERAAVDAVRARQGPGDSAAVTHLRAELYTALDRTDRVVEAALEYLRRIGVNWSPHPTKDEVRQEYEQIW